MSSGSCTATLAWLRSDWAAAGVVEHEPGVDRVGGARDLRHPSDEFDRIVVDLGAGECSGHRHDGAAFDVAESGGHCVDGATAGDADDIVFLHEFGEQVCGNPAEAVPQGRHRLVGRVDDNGLSEAEGGC